MNHLETGSHITFLSSWHLAQDQHRRHETFPAILKASNTKIRKMRKVGDGRSPKRMNRPCTTSSLPPRKPSSPEKWVRFAFSKSFIVPKGPRWFQTNWTMRTSECLVRNYSDGLYLLATWRRISFWRSWHCIRTQLMPKKFLRRLCTLRV